MEEQRNKKELIWIIVVTTVVAILHHEAAKAIGKVVTDTYLQAFLGELFFAILTLAAVIAFKKMAIFKSDTELLKKGWTSAGILFVLILYYLYIGTGAIQKATASFPQVMLFLGHCFLIGFCEEVLFRGLVQRAFHRAFKEDCFVHIFLALLCSGAVFGIVHLTNADLSVSILSIVYMSLSNIFAGMFYGAVYFRTGKNLWYNVILHGIYDAVGLILYGRLSGAPLNAVVSPSVSMQSFVRQTLTYAALYLLPTLIILRTKKLEPLLAERKDERCQGYFS